MPVKLLVGSGAALRLRSNFTTISNVSSGHSIPVLQRRMQRLSEWLGMSLSRTRYNPRPQTAEAIAELVQLAVLVVDANAELVLGVDESYTLDLPSVAQASVGENVAVICANTVWGALAAMSTFEQLLQSRPSGLWTGGTPTHVEDHPRFVHRGLLLDVARDYIPVAALARTVDTMALSKLNVLHLHITDSQSWPLEVPGFPGLTQAGAFAPYAVYSTGALAKLTNYSRDRGVRLLIEVDNPSHLTLRSGPNITVACGGTAGDPVKILDPTLDETFTFLGQIFEQLSSMLPPSYSGEQLLHLGGDEVDVSCWELEPRIMEWMHLHQIANGTTLWRNCEQRIWTHLYGRSV